MRLLRRLTTSGGERQLASDTLDRLATGIVLVDARGAALFANTAALRIASQQDGLTIERDGIHAGTSRLTNELARAINAPLG